MKPLLTLIIITWAMLAGPAPAHACSCVAAEPDSPEARERRVRSAFAAADAVFVGDVVALGRYSVTARVLRMWKGTSAPVVPLGNGSVPTSDGPFIQNSCADTFREGSGTRWLIFASWGDGRLGAAKCGLTMPLEHAAETEALLNKIAQALEPALDRRPSDQATLRADLNARLAPVAAWRQRTEATLRAAASPSAADAALLAARLELKEIVAKITAPLDTPQFQRLIWPDGAAGRSYRRVGGGPGHTAASEAATADTLVQFMKDRNLWPQRAEGDTYFHASETALLEWFGPLVSTEIRTFLGLWAHEQSAPVGEDASIQVSLDELERRIVTTERFLTAFPESAVRDPVRVRHQRYVALYLGGTSNTPAFELGILRPDLRRRFEAYVVAHDTPSGETVEQYLKLVSAQDYRRTPDVTRFLDAVRGDPTSNSRLLVY